MATRSIVTGGCGFIGSHLVELLLAEGHEVIVIDNLSTGRIENVPQQVQFHQVDTCNTDAIDPLFSGVNYVFHLAALADIVPSIERPMDYHRANVEGTICVLEAARKNNVEHFVYAASSSCYGLSDQLPTLESTAIDPQYPYALTKYLGETYVLHWAKIYGLPISSLRFFNVYGPRSRSAGTYGAVFGTFLAQKLAAKPFTIVGDGTQKRDFIFVTDVTRACLQASKSLAKDPQIMNVGTGNPQSINYLAQLLGGQIEYIAKRPGEPSATCADISRIRAKLGWEPKVTFEEGVRIMLENIDYWSNAPVWDSAAIEQATRLWFKYLK